MSVLAGFCCGVLSMESASGLLASCILARKIGLAIWVNHVERVPTSTCLLLQMSKFFEEIRSPELTLGTIQCEDYKRRTFQVLQSGQLAMLSQLLFSVIEG